MSNHVDLVEGDRAGRGRSPPSFTRGKLAMTPGIARAEGRHRKRLVQCTPPRRAPRNIYKITRRASGGLETWR